MMLQSPISAGHLIAPVIVVTGDADATFALLCEELDMTDIRAGDVVIARSIGECHIGHPAWHDDFDHPEMNRRTYMVTWSGYSRYGKRPVISVAGRREHFCAGCFTRQKPPELLEKLFRRARSEERIEAKPVRG